MPPPGTLTMTPKGRQKMAKILAAAIQGGQLGLQDSAATMRTTASMLAPSPDEEATLLSVGAPEGDFFGSATIGTPEGGRFLRAGTMVPVREAIVTDPILVERLSGNMVWASTGVPERINARTAFWWMTRRRGVQGPSYPYENRWLEALEEGGAWDVVPRGDWLLEPEPGVTATRMHKTVSPRHMYTRARVQHRAAARAAIIGAVRARVRSVPL